MRQGEDSVGGVPSSETTLCEEDVRQSKAWGSWQQRPDSPVPSCSSAMSTQSIENPILFKGQVSSSEEMTWQQRPDSPVPSCSSAMSTQSMEKPILFKGQASPPEEMTWQQRPDSPVPSCSSAMSTQSIENPLAFKGQASPPEEMTWQQRPDSPVPSCSSAMSTQSMEKPILFKGQASPPKEMTWQQRPDSPVPSCSSAMSTQSIENPLAFKGQASPPEEMTWQQRPDSPVPSCSSAMSTQSIENPLAFKGQASPPEEIDKEEYSDVSCEQSERDHEAYVDYIFMRLEEKIVTFVENKLKKIQKFPSQDYPQLESRREDEKELDGVGAEQCETLLKIILHFLRKIKQEALADNLQRKCPAAVCQRKLKNKLKEKVQCVSEEGNTTLLNQIYTELYITEGGSTKVSDGHEVRHIETASRTPDASETPIKLEELFKGPPGRDEPIRTVMTKGVAGIGKTVLTQKLTLDWAEGKANQDTGFMFPFTFRELNVLKERKFSLVELVHHFFTETKEAGICSFEQFQVVFIFDGLDECRLPLDFNSKEPLTDATEPTSVDVLLTNLIRGKLLPSARLWITTRPAAANQIPPECVGMVTEVRGFTDPQKEEYFRKRFRDEEQASRIISHIQTSRSLHIMCHIPVFCWITASVLEDVLETREGAELPSTLTEMYVHFLVVQTKVKKLKYEGGAVTDPHWSPESRKMIESLGKLAYEQLQKGNLIFYESDLTECGIDISAASVYSGVFTQIFREERGLHQEKVFSFVHLSVQEFLAALHVHLNCTTSGVNLFREKQTWFQSLVSKTNLKDVHNSAVDEALRSPNGHLDLFLRFLLGLSLPTNQTLLRGLLTQTGSSSQANQDTILYIKEKINANPSTEKSINLFHCLNELNDRSLVEEIQQSLATGSLSDKLSPAQWSALVFILLTSEADSDVFDLKRYSTSGDALLRLLPVVKASSKALLNFCSLSEGSFEALVSVLTSSSSRLRELDLRNNNLHDSYVKQLSDGLKSPNCSLETLRLSGCFLSDSDASALRLLSCSLRELDLSNNNLKDSGVKQLLSHGMESPQCNLTTLRLSVCNLSEGSCEALASLVGSERSSLIKLDLSNNNLRDSGVKQLSSGIKNPHCKLETLSLSGCQVADEGCAALDSALTSNPSHLRELDLSYNQLGDSGVKLSAKLADPNFRLDVLRTEPAGVQWSTPGLKKYSCELRVDPNTVNRNVKLSDANRKLSYEEEHQSYPDHPDRFNTNHQLLCENALTGRCYWEVEVTGGVHVSVSYRGISRRGEGNHGWFGGNDRSWTLYSSEGGYTVWHDKKGTSIPSSFSSSVSNRAAVYVDHPAGILSFYRVSSDALIHLHTFNTTFTEPLYPGFGLWTWSSSPRASSVSLLRPSV